MFEVSENKTFKPVNLDTIVEVCLIASCVCCSHLFCICSCNVSWFNVYEDISNFHDPNKHSLFHSLSFLSSYPTLTTGDDPGRHQHEDDPEHRRDREYLLPPSGARLSYSLLGAWRCAREGAASAAGSGMHMLYSLFACICEFVVCAYAPFNLTWCCMCWWRHLWNKFHISLHTPLNITPIHLISLHLYNRASGREAASVRTSTRWRTRTIPV